MINLGHGALLALSQHSDQLSNENSLKCFVLWKELLAEAKLLYYEEVFNQTLMA